MAPLVRVRVWVTVRIRVSLKVRVSFSILRLEGEHRYLSCITVYKLAQMNQVLIHSIGRSRGVTLLLRIPNSSVGRRSCDGRDRHLRRPLKAMIASKDNLNLARSVPSASPVHAYTLWLYSGLAMCIASFMPISIAAVTQKVCR